MARIRSLSEGTQSVRLHPTEVDSSYQVLSGDGETYLHLSTFGSDTRASAPKSSQSIQLDRRMAARLVEILQATFPGIT